MIQFLDQSNYASLLFLRLMWEENHYNMEDIVTCDKSWHDEDQVGDEVKSHHCYCGMQDLPSFHVVENNGVLLLTLAALNQKRRQKMKKQQTVIQIVIKLPIVI